ncbi:MAG: Na+/H+ antiporter [Anaerolineales bacterium]|nr:Na+/H+ antiporter [Anaerolineales bacterium]
MESILEVEILVLEILLVASVVAIVGRRFRIPYTVALVLAGVVLSLRAPTDIQVSPDLILALLVPPLVFEAAFHLDFKDLRENISTILLLAILGVVVNVAFVTGVLSLSAEVELTTALVFGSIIAATDPVAVVAIFRKLGAPRRLEVLLEGESLMNDGTAIVIYSLVLSALETQQFSLLDGLFDFVLVAGGGISVGIILGWMVSRLISRVDDHLVETSLTTVLAFGAYLAAEELHVSGVLAVVAAGVVNGNIGPRGMSPTTKVAVFNFWEYAAFLANSAIFLMIGFQTDIPAMIEHWQLIVWAIVAVLVGRAVVIYGLSRLGREIPSAWRHILFWGGLRGGIGLALALGLPAALGSQKDLEIALTFGVVLFSILVQGTSMNFLFRRLGIVVTSDKMREYEERRARALSIKAGYRRLEVLYQDGLVSEASWNRLGAYIRERIGVLTASVQQFLTQHPELEQDEIEHAREEMLRAQRSNLIDMLQDGLIREETYEELAIEIDAALESGIDPWKAQLQLRQCETDICQLMMVMIQRRDYEATSNALSLQGIPATSIESTGVFLRRDNILLLVGIPRGNLELAVSILERSCRSRVEYVSTPSEHMPYIMTHPVEVKIQGATVFLFNVDRYEVI